MAKICKLLELNKVSTIEFIGVWLGRAQNAWSHHTDHDIAHVNTRGHIHTLEAIGRESTEIGLGEKLVDAPLIGQNIDSTKSL